jgi:hypothetical protein
MIVEINSQHYPAGSANPAILFRQTPGGDGVWQDIAYRLAEENSPARWLVVFDEPLPESKTAIPRERRVLFVTEPPEVKQYGNAFLNQFGTIVSPMQHQGYQGRHIVSQPGLGWFYGSPTGNNGQSETFMDWQALSTGKPEKDAGISVVCSNKNRTAAQRERLNFVQHLRDEMVDEISFFGRGSNPITDKAEAISRFRYHIVLENNHIPHFWTEKLADAYLGGSFPFYIGCKNLEEYFPAGSFIYLDAARPAEAVKTIRQAVKQDLWAQSRAVLDEARQRLMWEHNFFALATRIIKEQDPVSTSPALSAPAALHTAKDFRVARRVGRTLRRLIS